MTNLNELIKNGELKSAIDAMDNVALPELIDAVQYLNSLTTDQINEKIEKLKVEISHEQAEFDIIKQEAIQYAKLNGEKITKEYSDKIIEVEKEISEIDKKIKGEVEEVNSHNSRECEKCGSKMKVRTSYKGQFLGCSSFPKCKNTSNEVKKLSKKASDLQYSKVSLLSKVSYMKKYISDNLPEKIDKPLYTQETSEIANGVIGKLNDLKLSIKIFEGLKKDKNTVFSQKLKLELQKEKMKPYLSEFLHKPYLKDEIVINNFESLLHIQLEITSKLKNYPGFKGIQFCDVSAGGIQIRGFHEEIKGYSYGEQPKINYDFSNVEEVIEEFVQMWKAMDNKKAIEAKKRFIEDGETYGWH